MSQAGAKETDGPAGLLWIDVKHAASGFLVAQNVRECSTPSGMLRWQFL